MISIAAALAGVLLARKLGRNAETDGFLAAYAVYLLLVLAAQAVRVVVLPQLARAAVRGALGGELRAYSTALAVVSLPALALSTFAAHDLGSLLTGGLPDTAGDAAGDALVWLVPAAVLQLYAVLGASALAALDDYTTAALGFAAGAAISVVVFLVLADDHGAAALAWGLAAGGVVAVAVPAVALAADAAFSSGTAGERPLVGRLGELGRGAVLPLALQGLYLIALRLAGDLGVGRITSFSYAYFVAAFLVSATASSLALVSSVPLARTGVRGGRAAVHVLNVSWLSLPVVAGAAGVFAVTGEAVVELVLGSSFAGDTGAELSRLVVLLGPWMVVSVALSVAFPLLFVERADRLLVVIAGAALAVHVPLAWALREALGLEGLSLALAVTTSLVLAGVLAALSRETLAGVARGLLRPAMWSGALAVLAFGAAELLLDDVAAAAAGLVGYVALLTALRPGGLTEAWSYMRALA